MLNRLQTCHQNFLDVLGLQVHITCGIADGALGDVGNHVGSSAKFADGQRQTDFLHPGFQGCETFLGYLLVSLSSSGRGVRSS